MSTTGQSAALRIATIGALLALAPAGCGGVESLPAELAGLPRLDIQVGGEPLRVVVAQDRARGLAGIDGLGDLDGMLFEYPAEVSPAAHPFWMAGVRFPLDITFFDDEGRLIETARMAPCDPPVRCPLHVATAPFRWVLETPAGRLQAEPGARLDRPT